MSSNNDIKDEVNNVSILKKIIVFSLLIIIVIVLFIIAFMVPKIKLNGDKTIILDVNSTYEEYGVTAKIGIKNNNKNLRQIGKIDTSKVGEYKTTYIIKSGLIEKKVTRTVKVVDTEKPIIELIGKKEINICPGKEYKEEGYKATDNYDGDITNNVAIEKKGNALIYTVFDSSKNMAETQRIYTEKDTESPKIKLKGVKTRYIALNSKYVEEGYTATDNCDGNIKNKVTISGNVNTSKAGTYEIKYSVSDTSGNKTSTTRKVIVYKKTTSTSSSNNKNGVIYLTFDDGPSSSITPKLLKKLKSKGVKATFFVVNHSSSLDYLIKQEYNEGHTVALHSYTHNYKTIYSSSSAYFNDLDKISSKVYKLTGTNSKIIRFPGGSSNTISRNYSKGIMSYLTSEVISRGYRYYDWNVGSNDAGGAKNNTQVYNNVINGLSKKRINIVLMHDFENNYKTLNAIDSIIDYGLSHGYRFEAINASTPMVRHGVNN